MIIAMTYDIVLSNGLYQLNGHKMYFPEFEKSTMKNSITKISQKTLLT